MSEQEKRDASLASLGSHNDARMVTSPAPFEGLQLLRLSPYTVINLGLVANFREGSYPLSVRTELLSGGVVYYYGEEAETLRAWLGERVPRWGPRLPPAEAKRRLQAAITEMARS